MAPSKTWVSIAKVMRRYQSGYQPVVVAIWRDCRVIDDLMPDDLWARIVPLLAGWPAQRHRLAARNPVDDRVALADIVCATHGCDAG